MKTNSSLVLTSALALACATACFGQTKTWTGGGDGISWTNAANWSGSILPGPPDTVAITSGAGALVVISSAEVIVQSIQCSKTLIMSDSSLTLTAGSSQLSGAFSISNNAWLKVSGPNTSFTASAATSSADASFYATGGAAMHLPNLKSVTNANYNPVWYADGAGSLLDLSYLTNLTLGYYEVLYVEGYNGGTLDLHRLRNTTGSVQVDARDASTLVDLSGLTGRWKSATSSSLSLEAQTGASILIPNVTQLENAALRLDDTGVITTSQLNLLTNVTLTVDGSTPNFGRLTNIDDTSIYALEGGIARLTNVYQVTIGMDNPVWYADGAGSLLDLSYLTNLTLGYYEVLYVEGYNGGTLDLHRLRNTTGSVQVDARDASTLVDLSGLTGRWKSATSSSLSLEAQTGASILIPNVTQLENAALRLDDTGVITTSQLNLLTNVTLTVDGSTPNFGRLTNIDDTSVYALEGGIARLTNVYQVTIGRDNPVWYADGADSLVDLSYLTNLTLGYYEVLYVEAYNGGTLDLHRLRNTTGSVQVDARDSSTLVDLSGITGRWKSAASSSLSLEAQTGASILIPNVTQLENASLRLDDTGVITTSQLNLLTNVTLTVDGSTPNFGRLTNIDDTSIYALEGGIARLTNVYRIAISNVNPVWDADGAGSLVDLSCLTNLTLGYYEVLYVEAYNGGTLDLHRLRNTTGSVQVDARDAGTLVDLSGLTGRWKSAASSSLRLEAQTGAFILIPNVTQLENASLRLDNTGAIPTSQLNLLTNVTLIVDGSTPNFAHLTNIDDSSIYALEGGIARLTNVYQVAISNVNPVWDADGAGSLVDLSYLTNLTLGYYDVLYVEGYDGGTLDLHRLRSTTGSVQVDARDAGTLVDLSGLTGRWKSAASSSLRLEAQTGASILIPNVTQLEYASLRLDNTGTIPTSQLNLLTNVTLIVDGSTPNFAHLTNIDDTSVYALEGGIARLTNVYWVTIGVDNPEWDADGAGSLVDLSYLTNLTIRYFEVLYVEAHNSGKVDLHQLISVATASMQMLADGTGSLINLSGLSCLISVGSSASSLTAQNSGAILFNNQAILLANVAIKIPSGNPILPATLVASPALTLYGLPWHSYCINQRNTGPSLSPWVFMSRVALTNGFQVLASSPSQNLQYCVWNFVTDPPILDICVSTGHQTFIIIYDAPGKTNQLLTATSLKSGASWQSGVVTIMTNSFQILAPTPASDPVRYYRAKRL